jgi:hypothetical protein
MNRFKEDEVVQETQAAAKPPGNGIDRAIFLGAWRGREQGYSHREAKNF